MTQILIFALLWWVIFYMALPIGVKIEEKPLPGHAESAPKNPNTLIKAVLTTIVAAILTWLIVTYFTPHMSSYMNAPL